MKLMYALTRRQFGKVPTPFTVFMARMPLAFGSFFGKIASLEKKLTLPPRVRMLIRDQAAHLDGCSFCQDSDRWFALRQSPEAVAALDSLPDTGPVSSSPTPNGQHSIMRPNSSATSTSSQIRSAASPATSANGRYARSRGCAQSPTCSTSPTSASASARTSCVTSCLPAPHPAADLSAPAPAGQSPVPRAA